MATERKENISTSLLPPGGQLVDRLTIQQVILEKLCGNTQEHSIVEHYFHIHQNVFFSILVDVTISSVTNSGALQPRKMLCYHPIDSEILQGKGSNQKKNCFTRLYKHHLHICTLQWLVEAFPTLSILCALSNLIQGKR